MNIEALKAENGMFRKRISKAETTLLKIDGNYNDSELACKLIKQYFESLDELLKGEG